MTTIALTVAFDGVLVVESLGPADAWTVTSLVEYVKGFATDSDTKFPIGSIICRTSVEFEALLGRLTEEASLYGKWPWLHLEAHGSAAQGIIFEDGSSLEWTQVAQHFTALNLATRFNLGVSFATCHGAEFFREVNPSQPSPVLAAIGPTDEISSSEILSRYSSFYRALAKTRNFQAGVQALEEIPLTHGIFIAGAVTDWFKETCLLRMGNACLPSVIEKRAKGMVKTLKKRGINRSRGITRRTIIEMDRDRFIGEWFRTFFMTDVLPANVSRFANLRMSLDMEVKKVLSGRC